MKWGGTANWLVFEQYARTRNAEVYIFIQYELNLFWHKFGQQSAV